MTLRTRRLLMSFLLAGLTVALGFVTWWSFVVLAFGAGFWLQRKIETPVRTAAFSPAIGWVLACLARDLFEDGRISAKLANLLHLQISVAVYAAIFLMIAALSFLAAYSGATISKALR